VLVRVSCRSPLFAAGYEQILIIVLVGGSLYHNAALKRVANSITGEGLRVDGVGLIYVLHGSLQKVVWRDIAIILPEWQELMCLIGNRQKQLAIKLPFRQ
jgi:hypothetical protein